MKKTLALSVLFLMAAVAVFAQSLSLSNASGPIAPNSTLIQAGTPDSVELITYLNVKNNGNTSMDVLCKKTELTMLDSTEVTICWAGGCYPSTTFVSPNFQPIPAGQTNTEFVGHYTQIAFNHFKPGESVVRWTFFDRSNPNDSVSVTVKYTSFPLGVAETSGKATMSAFYPNPVSSVAACNYTLPAGTSGSIIVRDMVGTTVRTIELPSASGKAQLNAGGLRDGIYFCSLLVNGSVSQTKKLVVKH